MKKALINLLFFELLMFQISASVTTPNNNITVHDGLAHNAVQCIAMDKYGFLWFGTLNGLSRYDGYTIKNYQASASDQLTIPNNRIQIIYTDKNNDLWISTFDSVICKYNYEKDNFTRYLKKNVSEEIRIGTDRFLNTSRLQAFSADKEFFIKDNQNLFVRDLQTGIVRDGRNLFPFTITKQDLNCVFTDQSGVLWIGTIYNGVFKIDLNAKQFHTEVLLLSNHNEKAAVRSILKDGKNIYTGTFEDGLIIKNLTDGKLTHYNEPLIAGSKVRSIFKDSRGDIWIGYNSGADRIEGKTGKLLPVSLRGNITRYDKEAWLQMKSLPNRNYFCIAEDPSGTIWLGTYNGIFRFNRSNNTFQYVDLSEYANATIITGILPESADKLWIASEGGVFCIEKNQVTGRWKTTKRYHFESGNTNSLPDDRVYAIQKDKKGMIWAGSENGLCRINPVDNSVTVYNQTNGLSDPGIAALLLDKHDQLWISHKKGISRLDTKSLTIKNYNVPAIDKNGQFLIGSAFYDTTEDQLFFGYSEGYIWFRASEIHDNHIRPLARLTNLRIDNQLVSIDQEINHRIILKKPLYESSAIVLTHKERSFSIEFSCTHFANPELNQFEYILEGFDKDWIKTNADNRVAVYSGLQPGKYVFKVRAANADNIRSNQITQLEINVLTPWWKTWWAIIIFMATFLGLLYSFLFMLLSKQKIQYQLGYEKLRAGQMEEVAKIRTNFFTNISHELRTPLTLIIDPINRLLQEHQHTGDKLRLEVIKRNAERLLTLVNELLDMRKAEEGSLKVTLKPLNVNTLLENIRKAFEISAQERNLSLLVLSVQSDIWAMLDAEKTETILYNLIFNAIKNADTNSEITISLKINQDQEQQNITIVIQNAGKTIEISEQQRIFDPFYQSGPENNSGIRGTGLGLTIARQFVELQNGKIWVESENRVTRFVIILPLLPLNEKENLFESSNNENLQIKSDIIVQEIDIQAVTTIQPAEKRPLVLIIEDNVDIRLYIQSELEHKYHFLSAEHGEAGVNLCSKYIPDLVITDVMMPLMDGYEVCRNIKSDIRTCHIPVLMLTALQSENSRIQGYETGADAYLTKPFSIQMLEVRIHNLLARKEQLIEFYQQESTHHSEDFRKSENHFLSELRSHIIHSEGNYNVEMLAENLSMSRSQLYRKIKRITNQSATDFIAEVRMNYACQLLAEGKYNISEIAAKLGYSEQANFSRSFYRRYGKYPSQYLSVK